MWWESDLAHREKCCAAALFLAHRLGRILERSEIAWGCLWVRLGRARGQNKISNSCSQFGLRGRALRGVTGGAIPRARLKSGLPPTCFAAGRKQSVRRRRRARARW